jgi:hypothetical protein
VVYHANLRITRTDTVYPWLGCLCLNNCLASCLECWSKGIYSEESANSNIGVELTLAQGHYSQRVKTSCYISVPLNIGYDNRVAEIVGSVIGTQILLFSFSGVQSANLPRLGYSQSYQYKPDVCPAVSCCAIPCGRVHNASASNSTGHWC